MQDVVDLYHDEQADPVQRVMYARLLREAARCPVVQWVMSEWEERRAILNAGLRRLLRAAGVRLANWCQLPPFSKARSDILLRGAEALGIATEWPGWA